MKEAEYETITNKRAELLNETNIEKNRPNLLADYYEFNENQYEKKAEYRT